MLSRVRAIADSNIAVMGHVGLTPQSATKLGGFKAQGRTGDAAVQLFDDALALQEAGCFAIVLEAVPAPVAARDHGGARRARRSGSAPAPRRDGQVLVWHDLLGLYEGRTPRFVKRYAEHRAARSATPVEQYADDVRDGRVPRGAAHVRDLRRRARACSRPLRQSDLSASAEHDRHDDRERAGAAARAPRPAVHGAHADHEQHDRPGDERELEHGRRRRRRRPCRCRRCGTSRSP